MRRRILLAIVCVTLLATAVLTVPLAVVISNRENNDSYRELDRVAERAVAGLPRTLNGTDGAVELPHTESSVDVAVYDASDNKIAGNGPTLIDVHPGSQRVTSLYKLVGSERVVARPVTLDDRRIGVVRVAEPANETTARVRKDVLGLIVIDLAALLVAAAVGWFVAARLVRPLNRIRDDAVRLGNGDFSIRPVPSGVAELDETAEALADTASRLERSLRREREFSANASHQLRTPITAMRLGIEVEMAAPRPEREDVLRESLTELDRLELTIGTLLAVARDQSLHRAPIDATKLANAIRARWNGRLAATGRNLSVTAPVSAMTTASIQIVEQILDVLLDNACQHGAGQVRVSIGTEGDTFVTTVSDDGAIDREHSGLFRRRDPDASGHGVGLSLARALAEAEGGRLTLSTASPTTFRLVLPAHKEAQPGE